MDSRKLSKADILDVVYDKTGMTRKDIREVVDCFVDEIKDALTRWEGVELRGFGSFEVRSRKARDRARNPRTGELISVPAHGSVSFRPGQELKQLVWEKGGKKRLEKTSPPEDPAPAKKKGRAPSPAKQP